MATNLSVTGLGNFSLQQQELHAEGVNCFQSVLTDSSLTECTYHKSYPVTPWQDSSGTCEFLITQPGATSYTDLSSVRLEGEWFVKQIKDDNTLADIEQNDTDISVINMIPVNLWKNVEILFNQDLVHKVSSFNNGIKYHLEHDLSHDEDARKIYLPHMVQYSPDSDLNCDASDNNAGFKNRATKYVQKSPKNHFCIAPPGDIWASSGFLPPICQIRIKLLRNSIDFLLLRKSTGTKKYTLLIENLCVTYRRYNINPSIVSQHQKLLAKNAFKFPILTTDIKTYPLSTGSQNLIIPALTQVQEARPSQIHVFFLSTKRVLGNLELTPYISKNPGLTRAVLQADGQDVPETYDFTTSYATKMAYLRALEGLGSGYPSEGHVNTNFTLSRFENSLFHLVWNLTPQSSKSIYSNQGHQPPLSLDIQLKQALTEPMIVVVYSTLFSCLCINGAGQSQLVLL